MRHTIYAFIAFWMQLQPEARAEIRENAASPDAETIGAVLLVGVGVGTVGYFLWKPVSFLIAHDSELSAARKNSYALFEAGRANEHGSSFTAGAFIGQDHLLLARLSQHIIPNSLKFKSYELGYRYYSKILFSEIGLFSARHQQSQNFPQLNSNAPRYKFDTYQTNGAFFSLGITTNFWQISLGVRGTIHKGLSTQTVQSYINPFETRESCEVEARDQYKLRGTGYLEIGAVI